MFINAIGDPSDVTSVIHFLVESRAQPEILDVKLVDVSDLFENDPSLGGLLQHLQLLQKIKRSTKAKISP